MPIVHCLDYAPVKPSKPSIDPVGSTYSSGPFLEWLNFLAEDKTPCERPKHESSVPDDEEFSDPAPQRLAILTLDMPAKEESGASRVGVQRRRVLRLDNALPRPIKPVQTSLYVHGIASTK